MVAAFDCARYASAVRDALQAALPGVEVAEEPSQEVSALTFTHPVHEATVVVLIEAGGEATMLATILLAIVIGDWKDLEAKGGAAQLFALNPRLMTCAVGVMPLNDDELAVVLCRRAPAATVAPDEVGGLVDDMIWDYAQCSGWLEQAQTAAVPAPAPAAPAPPLAPARPRLIGSLDDL